MRYPLSLDTLKSWTPLNDPFCNMDSHGWQPFWRSVTPAQRERLTQAAYRQYRDVLQDSRLAERTTGALRETLSLCRREGVPVALVAMPEASAFQALYPAKTKTTLDAFVTGLCREWHVPLIDARCWVADSQFYDTHHLLPEGAATFSDRLAQDAVRPLLRTLASKTTLPSVVATGASTQDPH
jgi:hypothetical protein